MSSTQTINIYLNNTTDATSGNDIHHVYFVGQTFGEHGDPAMGGIDRAIVHDIFGQYELDAGDGIETLEAYDGNAYGVDIKGNELANLIIGGQFADTLEGGGVTGAVSETNHDVLRGGADSDTYVVNAEGVVIDETANGDGLTDAGGTDDAVIIGSQVAFGNQWSSYRLTQFVEHLDASQSSGIVTLNGNGLGNRITGNASSNVLFGGAGNDTLDGGAGAVDLLDGGADDDTYLIHNSQDAVIELFNGGTDTVRLDGVVFDATWSAYTLANFVETLDGSNSAGEVTLTGNDESNLIIGNTSANVLIGGLGNDTLDGGGAPDQFNGGAGNDTYRSTMPMM